MKKLLLPSAAVATSAFASIPAVVLAEGAAWHRFVVSTTGTNVEIPLTDFSKDASCRTAPTTAAQI